MEIRQPQMITTMGVRQPTPAANFATAPCNVIVGISPAELIGPDPIEPVGLAKRIIVILAICAAHGLSGTVINERFGEQKPCRPRTEAIPGYGLPEPLVLPWRPLVRSIWRRPRSAHPSHRPSCADDRRHARRACRSFSFH